MVTFNSRRVDCIDVADHQGHFSILNDRARPSVPKNPADARSRQNRTKALSLLANLLELFEPLGRFPRRDISHIPSVHLHHLFTELVVEAGDALCSLCFKAVSAPAFLQKCFSRALSDDHIEQRFRFAVAPRPLVE